MSSPSALWSQIGLLHKQLEDVQTDRQELDAKYEQQLQKVREEVRQLHLSVTQWTLNQSCHGVK